MSPDALNSLFSLLIGFALAGALVSGYQAFVQRPAGFGLLQQEAVTSSFIAVPFLVFAAPFIIMRNTIRGRQVERIAFAGTLNNVPPTLIGRRIGCSTGAGRQVGHSR